MNIYHFLNDFLINLKNYEFYKQQIETLKDQAR